jgi:hypothetical protein
LTSVAVLEVLLKYPKGLNAGGVAEAIEQPELKKKISVMLPYLAIKNWALSKGGSYTITKAGKARLAENQLEA